MKKTILAITLCLFALCLTLKTPAYCQGITKIGYVNVATLLASSKNLKDAEATRKKQTEDMLKWYKTASEDIAKQKTEEGKKSLIKKYEDQLTNKKKNIKETYAKKIATIDEQLNTIISTKAKAMGYDVVLRSDSVLFGATDITKEILPLVK